VVSPRRRRLALHARFHPRKNINSVLAAEFLGHLLKALRGHVVLLWDSGRQHKGLPIRNFLRRHLRLHTFHFPGYAPELNPEEWVWKLVKGPLANSAPKDLHELKALIHRPLQRLRQSQKLLWSCIYASELPWER
jgi:transposase